MLISEVKESAYRMEAMPASTVRQEIASQKRKSLCFQYALKEADHILRTTKL